MTVYVDNMKMRCKFFGWNGTWSNLWADTNKELVDFADEELNLSRVSMIDEGYTTERFVITETRRRTAIERGAVPIQYGGVAMYKLIRRKRERGNMKEKEL